jgi:hypothetical protein
VMKSGDEMRSRSSPTAREEEKPWAGAQRPKAGSADALTGNSPAMVYTQPKKSLSLGMKLRKQALRLGLIPGSARWRAYVLGTQAAAAKRRQSESQKAKAERRGSSNSPKVGPWRSAP